MKISLKRLEARYSRITIILIIVTSLLSYGAFYLVAKDAKLYALRQRLTGISIATAAAVNGDLLVNLQPGSENSESFLSIRDTLRKTRKNNPTIRYSYILLPTKTGATFLVDDTYGSEAGSASIGQVYGVSTEQLTLIQKALSEPTFTQKPYTDDWGTFYSSYSPIHTSDGRAVAVLGMDVLADTALRAGTGYTATVSLILICYLAVLVLLFWNYHRQVQKAIRNRDAS